MYCLWLLSNYSGRFESLRIPRITQSCLQNRKYFLSGPLQRKVCQPLTYRVVLRIKEMIHVKKPFVQCQAQNKDPLNSSNSHYSGTDQCPAHMTAMMVIANIYMRRILLIIPLK